MSEKLSERLDRLAGLTVESPAPHLTGGMKFYVYDAETREAMTEAAAALRAVEGAAVVTLEVNAWQTSELCFEADHLPLAPGQRVALVPLDAAGSAEGVG